MKHGVPELAAEQIKKEQGIDKYNEEGWQTKEKKVSDVPFPFTYVIFKLIVEFKFVVQLF